MAIKKSTDQDFQKIISSQTPVLIKFEADWCAPCRSLTPIVEEISEEMKDQVNFFSHNIESEPNIPTKVGPVRGIPHMILFRNSEILAQRTGSIPKGPLVAWIKENI